MLSKHQIVNWLLDCEHIFAEQRDYLTALDTDIGDGDHGLNMQRGFTKVAEKLPAVADKDIGQVLKTTGMTLLSSVGGASGPLYGTFFIRAAASTDACQSLSLSQLCKMLSDGVEGIVSRGRAEPGDKTMCDAWWPALAALQQAQQQELPLKDALDKAVAAAAAGERDGACRTGVRWVSVQNMHFIRMGPPCSALITADCTDGVWVMVVWKTGSTGHCF